MLTVNNLFNNQGQKIEGPLVLTPEVKKDERGFFLESWNQQDFNSILGTKINFVQDAHSYSKIGVIRGMHYQLPPFQQGRLVRCIAGEIYDVVVDIRKDSPTFATWASSNLTSANHKQVWIPSGFAHGFLTISQSAEVLYKMTQFWNKESERTIKWNDNIISIDWPCKAKMNQLSYKDYHASTLNELNKDTELF